MRRPNGPTTIRRRCGERMTKAATGKGVDDSVAIKQRPSGVAPSAPSYRCPVGRCVARSGARGRLGGRRRGRRPCRRGPWPVGDAVGRGTDGSAVPRRGPGRAGGCRGGWPGSGGQRAGCRSRRPGDGASCPSGHGRSDSGRSRHPLFAATAALSNAPRDQSMALARLSRSSSTWCSVPQTPACCQSRSRRQQVMPDPQPSHGAASPRGCRTSARTGLIAERSRVSATRSDTRGRPPFGRGGGGGSRGASSAPSASGTSGLAMLV